MLLILIFETSEMLVIVRSENPNIVAQSLSHVWLFATLWMAAQKGRKCPPPSPGVHSDSYISSRWCHPTTSSSVVPFSSHLQSFLASGSFQWVSFSHQVSKILALQLQHQSFPWIFGVGPLQGGLVGPLAVNIQGWSPPGWLVGPLQSRGSEALPAPQLPSVHPSVLSLPYGPTRISVRNYWKNHSFDYMDLCQQSNVSAF